MRQVFPVWCQMLSGAAFLAAGMGVVELFARGTPWALLLASFFFLADLSTHKLLKA